MFILNNINNTNNKYTIINEIYQYLFRYKILNNNKWLEENILNT